MKELSDAELMGLVANGDFSAFDELYRRYQGSLRGFLFSLTWDRETTEDYLQEVFLRLFRSRESYVPSGKFSSYLFRIARNYYLSECRKRRRVKSAPPQPRRDDGFRPLENLPASERVDPQVRLLERYRLWRIRRAIESLPPGQRLVFVMSHLEDMPYADIAEVLRIPVGTVKSRMFAAVRKLRDLLEEG